MVDVTEYLPDVSLEGGMVVTVITWFVIIIVAGILVAIGSYLLVRRMKFNKKIVLFQKIGGRYDLVGTDQAMTVKFGEAGDSILYTRKSKKYLPTPSIQTGKNTFWFAIREDLEWINIGLGDIDEQMREVKAHFLDKEMRYARVALQRNLKERYQKPSFWSVYGGIIAYATLILVTGIMAWLLFDKFIEISAEVGKAIEAAKEVLEATQKVLVSLDSVKGGSGLVPAG